MSQQGTMRLFWAYCILAVVALLLPWWLAIPALLIPLPFIRFPWVSIVVGLMFDIIYGHSVSGFPFHTFRYTLIMVCGIIVATLLKKVLRL